MAEFRKLPTQAELQNMLFMEQMRVKTPQQIAQEALASGTTVSPIPENVFQKIAGGARTSGQFVNRIGTAADIAKLFPGYKPETRVTIPTGYNFAPKQAPTGEVIPGGLQTQNVNLGQVLGAIKPADVLGLTGFEKAYTDVGLGKAPQPLDVLDVAAVGYLPANAAMSGARIGKAVLSVGKNLPIGLSIKDVSKTGGLLTEAPRSPLGFYSALEESALNLQRNKGSGQAFLNDLQKAPNVKADEIKWTGLDEFLKTKPNVTKQEVQDYLANNRVDVQEVQLGGAQPYNAQRLSQLESEYRTLKQHPIDDPSFGEEKYNELIRLANIRDQSTTQTLYDSAERAMQNAQRAQRQGNNLTAEKYFREAEFFNTRAEKLDLEGQGMSNPPKFGQYTLPGGENYREILLTMPTKTTKLRAEADRISKLTNPTPEEIEIFKEANRLGDQEYRSTHFPDQRNILAHLRVNDRVDADGKKMLLIEEVQSDWHQAGREKGYGREPSTFMLVNPETSGAVGNFATREEAAEFMRTSPRADEFAQRGFFIFENKGKVSVPDAPFKDSWYQLALKRAIQYAAENGYDRIGLTTGSQQAARFDLSKQVDRIDVESVAEVPNLQFVDIDVAGGQKIALEVENGLVREGEFAGKRLSDVVGKEMADKISKVAQGETRSLAGEDLRIGGEGMKKYYDEIYPKFLDKYGKKWGARVGETSLGGQSLSNADIENKLTFTGSKIKTSDGKFWDDYDDAMRHEGSLTGAPTVRYLDVTPEMKASVSKGQPLFQALPAIPATGLLATQDEER